MNNIYYCPSLIPNLPLPQALLAQRSALVFGGPVEPRLKPELTCISEEGIADMDLPDDLLLDGLLEEDDDDDYLQGDCITSCDKVGGRTSCIARGFF